MSGLLSAITMRVSVTAVSFGLPGQRSVSMSSPKRENYRWMSDRIPNRRRTGWRPRRYAVPGVIVALALGAGLAGALGPDPLDLDLRASDSSGAANKQPKHAEIRRASGELHSLVYHLVDVLSRREAYQRPRPGQAARLASAFGAVRAGQLNRAAALAQPLGYKVVRYRDAD